MTWMSSSQTVRLTQEVMSYNLCCSPLQGDDGVPGVQGFPGTDGQFGAKGEICVTLSVPFRIIV